MKTLLGYVLGFVILVFAYGFLTVLPAEARGRTGSFRVGGYTSHGKGSHYVGGYVGSGSSLRTRHH